MLESRLKGADGFFIVTDPFSAKLENRRVGFPHVGAGRNSSRRGRLFRAAKAAKVPHVILGSVSILALEKGLGVHKSKISIERQARELGLNCTILRPPFFMEG